MGNDHVNSEPWHSQDSLFTQAFLRIFRDIQRCWCILSLAHRHATCGQGGWRERKSPLPFLKMKNSVLILRQRGFDFVHFWLKFSIQNAVLIVSGRETPKCFPFGPHFFCCWQNVYWSALGPHPPLPWKISGCAPAFRHYSFCKMLHHKCLTVFWICLSQ